MSIDVFHFEAIACPDRLSIFRLKAFYAGIVIDDNISLQNEFLVGVLLRRTQHLIFVGPRSKEAEDAADWIIVDSEEEGAVTSSLGDGSSSQDVAELLVARGFGVRGEGNFLYLFDQNRVESNILALALGKLLQASE